MAHINPDHFLQTPEGRLTTPERNSKAWELCHAALREALSRAAVTSSRLYLLIGAQGAGKTTWARARKALEPDCIVFDAILVKRSERAPILAQASRHGVAAIAVWFQTTLEHCVARNAARPLDELASEHGLRNVFAALEPPAHDEGFADIWQVWHDGAHRNLARKEGRDL
jgi:AAA domain